MIIAYNNDWVYNLAVLREAKRWCKQGLIQKEQLAAIADVYKCSFYHPGFMIRILLFVATLIALSGVTGLFFVFVSEFSKEGLAMASLFYGLLSFFLFEKTFIKSNHFKSGVTEAFLYHCCGFTIAGVSDFNPHIILWVCLLVFSFASIRYLDLICTLAATLSLAGILFYEFYSVGGLFQQIIPFVFIVGFSVVFYFVKKLKKKNELRLWRDNLLIVESVSLLLIYAGGNYFVVRELSVSMLGLEISEGEDIPFAFIFYVLTVMIPALYLYFGIRRKDIVLLRVSMIVLAFSVFTFNYYFGPSHYEIILTAAGTILLLLSIVLLNYLKIPRHGFTRENLLVEKWANMNVEALIISQTMGGNQVHADDQFRGGGGEFGGGGASGNF